MHFVCIAVRLRPARRRICSYQQETQPGKSWRLSSWTARNLHIGVMRSEARKSAVVRPTVRAWCGIWASTLLLCHCGLVVMLVLFVRSHAHLLFCAIWCLMSQIFLSAFCITITINVYKSYIHYLTGFSCFPILVDTCTYVRGADWERKYSLLYMLWWCVICTLLWTMTVAYSSHSITNWVL